MAVDVIARGIAGAVKIGLAQANEKIDRLEGKTTRILYAAKTNPTATEIGDFVNSLGYTSPYEGVAVVVAGTYHIWHYYENDSIGWRDDGVDTITPFTNTVPGSILGSTDDGKICANNDGTGSVNGWSNKLDKQTAVSTYVKVYAKQTDGAQTMLDVSTDSTAWTIVRRNGSQIPLPNQENDIPSDNQAISKKYGDLHYLAKQTDTATYERAYVVKADGTQGIEYIAQTPVAYTIAMRDASGRLKTADPSASNDATNKEYVDNKLTATLTQLSDGTYSLTFGV